MQEVDLNDDGVIDYSEFLTLVKVWLPISPYILLNFSQSYPPFFSRAGIWVLDPRGGRRSDNC